MHATHTTSCEINVVTAIRMASTLIPRLSRLYENRSFVHNVILTYATNLQFPWCHLDFVPSASLFDLTPVIDCTFLSSELYIDPRTRINSFSRLHFLMLMCHNPESRKSFCRDEPENDATMKKKGGGAHLFNPFCIKCTR